MNYIVFDLEWNQASQKQFENFELPFEIIEIGAVKLDETRKIVDRFSRLVRPVVYPHLFHRVRAMVKLTEEILRKQGGSFPEVFGEFMEWCGSDAFFCTWGPMDLTELQKNAAYYRLKKPFSMPLYYYDVQKLYSLFFSDGKTRISLEHAVEELLIIPDEPFHRAVNDAYYTALLFEAIDMSQLKKRVSIDYYQLPQNKKEEIYIVFDNYSKFVSREFTDKEQAIRDKGVSSTVCYQCGHSVRRKIPWFSDSSRNYYSLSYCPEHGYIKGKIRIRHGKDGGVFVIKTLKLVGDKEAEKIRIRHRELRERRKEKRKHESN